MVEHPVRHPWDETKTPKTGTAYSKKCDNKISEYGSIIIAEEHDITSANTFPADDEKEEFCVVIIQGNGH